MSDIQFGSLLPIPNVGTDRLIHVAERCESRGFDTVWAPDHLVMEYAQTVPNSWTILTAAAARTNQINVGSAVTDPHRYHPAVLAQIIATVDNLSKGRVILGLGAGEKMNLKPYGLPMKNRVSRLKEAIEVIKRLWKEDEVCFSGDYFNIEGGFLQISPYENKEVPIYLAANSPKTRELVAEYAEGWIPFSMSPKLLNEFTKGIKSSCRGFGRSFDEIDVALWVYTAIAGDFEEAYSPIGEMKERIVDPGLLRKTNYEIDFDHWDSGFYFDDFVPTEKEEEKLRELGSQIPREAAIDFSIVGTVDDCIDKIEDYVDAGVTHFILINVGPDPGYVAESYSKEIIPYFKDSR